MPVANVTDTTQTEHSQPTDTHAAHCLEHLVTHTITTQRTGTHSRALSYITEHNGNCNLWRTCAVRATLYT